MVKGERFFFSFSLLQSYWCDMVYWIKRKGYLGFFLVKLNEITVNFGKYEIFRSISLLNLIAHFYLLFNSIIELFVRNAIMDKTKGV